MSERIFTACAEAKSGAPVPLFRSGKTMHSRYDPVREAGQFAGQAERGSVFLVAGFGGGYHVRALLDRFPDALILAAEQSEADIDFLCRNIPEARALAADSRVVLFPLRDTGSFVRRNYLPALHGSLVILEHRGWAEENPCAVGIFREQTKSALDEIRADFSVQAHFGRIWQRNILANLKHADCGAEIRVPAEKTAVIAAAGPSLDAAIEWICRERDRLYVIATDTAYSSLCGRRVFCDAVVSIDGQAVSRAHFMRPPDSRTLFVFDLCANTSAVRRVRAAGCRTIFAETGHPFCRYAEKTQRSGGPYFMNLEAGAGTVTVAAADFALKAGFSDIAAAGADFAYPGGKPYARGTYLDDLYGSRGDRTAPAETSFCALMFRTPLIRSHGGNRVTTEVLESYRRSFFRWLGERGLSVGADGGRDGAILSARRSRADGGGQKALRFEPFDFEKLRAQVADDRRRIESLPHLRRPYPDAVTAALPCAAWFCNENSRKRLGQKPEDILKLAFSDIVRYTYSL